MRRFSRRTTWQSALAGMVTGIVVFVLSKKMGLGDIIYEIIPGFGANCITVIIVNMFFPQANQDVLNEYDEIATSVGNCES